jgi:hypothetical protein
MNFVDEKGLRYAKLVLSAAKDVVNANTSQIIGGTGNNDTQNEV